MTITVGDAFDVMEGITVHDKEDGDLTAAVDYELVYTVSDSEGLETTDTRGVTIKEKPDPNNTYDPTKQYNVGDKVMYDGKEYTAKWWITSTPGSDDSWERI